jgi:hypothetical protein
MPRAAPTSSRLFASDIHARLVPNGNTFREGIAFPFLLSRILKAEETGIQPPAPVRPCWKEFIADDTSTPKSHTKPGIILSFLLPVFCIYCFADNRHTLKSVHRRAAVANPILLTKRHAASAVATANNGRLVTRVSRETD